MCVNVIINFVKSVRVCQPRLGGNLYSFPRVKAMFAMNAFLTQHKHRTTTTFEGFIRKEVFRFLNDLHQIFFSIDNEEQTVY